MKTRKTVFSLLVTLILLAGIVTTAYAATQSIGGTAVANNLRVTVQDNGAMEIAQYNGGVWQENIYGTSAKGSTFCVGTTRYDMGGNSTWSPGAGGTAATWVSNTGGGSGTGAIVTTWTAGGMTIVQTTSYTDGNQYYTMQWAITNNSGGDINDLRLFNGQDTLLAGSDSGNGWWNAGLGTYGSIGVTHPTNGQQMWLQPVSEAPFNYESRVYYTSRSHVDACALDGTVTAGIHDNGYALEFRHATLANGATWNVTLEEHFVPSAPPTPAPTITGVTPNAGPTSGGTTVTITGTDLTGGTFTFGGSTATCTVAPDGLSATCTTPSHAAGLVDVAVTTPGGTDTETGAFTYVPPPSIASIVPNYGPTIGGTTVVITGTDLTGGTVTFGGLAAACTVDSDTQITCITPPHAVGPVDVVVTTPYGSGTAVNGFTYVPVESMIFYSNAAYDGFVLESGENTGLGGSKNLTGMLSVGDHYTKRQYKSILDFYTEPLPDDATLLTANLKAKKYNIVGSPFATLGTLWVDVSAPINGDVRGLFLNDFAALPGIPQVGFFALPPVGGWYTADVMNGGANLISPTGVTTQYRVYFELDDDNDARTDLVNFYSGNAGAVSRPFLIVEFYRPPGDL